MSGTGFRWDADDLVGAATGITWHDGRLLGHADPYLVWFDLSGFKGAALRDGEGVRLLIEEPGPVPRYRSSSVAVAELAQWCQRIQDTPGLRFELSTPILTPDATSPADRRGPDLVRARRQTLAASDCVVGFIDIGCAFANRQFRRWQDGNITEQTRVAAIWDQGELANHQDLSWTVPADFGYGAQALRDPTDQHPLTLASLMAAHRTAGALDEAACYAASGHRPALRQMTHGTHMMDVATGYPDPWAGIAALASGTARPHDADIVFVSLPRSVRGRSIAGMLRAQVLDGLRYIVSRASPKARVIVNISYGAYCGPHDGSSIVERAIEQDIRREAGRLQVVVAAGNAGNRKLHARARIAPHKAATFDLQLMPDDGTDTFAEFWLPDGAGNVLVRAIPPGAAAGTDADWIEAGRSTALKSRDDILAALIFPARACQSTGRRMVLLAVAPTRPGQDRAAAPYGRWRIEFRNESQAEVAVDAWCERDDPAFGTEAWPRQACFVDGKGSRVDASNTLSSLAHGPSVIVVGAYVSNGRRASGRQASGSSRGGTDARARQPDWLSPSDQHPAIPGLPGAAVLSGHSRRLNGTSVAAAHVTRLLIEHRLPEPAAPVARRNAAGQSTGPRPAAGAPRRPRRVP